MDRANLGVVSGDQKPRVFVCFPSSEQTHFDEQVLYEYGCARIYS
ncbi:MAG: hypothetical protein AAGH17_10605 [Pseudomonadota bacterium]